MGKIFCLILSIIIISSNLFSQSVNDLRKSIINNDIKKIENLIKDGVPLEYETGPHGEYKNSIFPDLVDLNNVHILELCLSRNIDINSQSNNKTALMRAIELGFEDVFFFLLENDADIHNEYNSPRIDPLGVPWADKVENGGNAIYFAAKTNNMHFIFTLLILGANPFIKHYEYYAFLPNGGKMIYNIINSYSAFDLFKINFELSKDINNYIYEDKLPNNFYNLIQLVSKKKYYNLLYKLIMNIKHIKYDKKISDLLRRSLYNIGNFYFRTNPEIVINSYKYAILYSVSNENFLNDPEMLLKQDLKKWKKESESNAPNYYIAYNLACAYSLNIMIEDSIKWLTIAFRLNKNIIKLFNTDNDLKNVREYRFGGDEYLNFLKEFSIDNSDYDV